ncbi:hypothetical protein HMI55_006983 [Coelomomyces lativittatus]|nr:hypothetical protein HMI56_005671 [Coelomomyces lativittatus]KAJ1510468.1 hypothetical protein HMI55_006983 [Coelomomyces lativittatus]
MYRLLNVPSNLANTFSMLSPDGFDVIQGLLSYDPTTRWTPQRALQSPYFQSIPNCCQTLLANPNIQKQIRISEEQACELAANTQIHRKRRRLDE